MTHDDGEEGFLLLPTSHSWRAPMWEQGFTVSGVLTPPNREHRNHSPAPDQSKFRRPRQPGPPCPSSAHAPSLVARQPGGGREPQRDAAAVQMTRERHLVVLCFICLCFLLPPKDHLASRITPLSPHSFAWPFLAPCLALLDVACEAPHRSCCTVCKLHHVHLLT